MWTYTHTDELFHHGIKGMKWGVRRTPAQLGHRPTSIKAALARRANSKVDEGFRKWKESDKSRDDAIDLGKKANAARMAYESDRSSKELKKSYREANRQYKKALAGNTTYRKGVVRQEVGRDASRQYLSEAKKVKKQLDADPTNRELQAKYNQLMSKHDVERAAARRAVEVASKRSNTQASMKRHMTMAVKAAAATAAATAGAYAVNKVLKGRNVSAQNIRDIGDMAKKGKKAMGYFY